MVDLEAAFPDGVSADGFLGGRIKLLQPRKGYRAGVDPVFLAAAVPAKSGDSVLDLGCGIGTAALCLGARVRGLRLSGVDVQPAFCELARRNADASEQKLKVYTDDLFVPDKEWAHQSFDVVMTNPPYYRDGTRTTSPDPSRERGLGECAPLAGWIDVAIRRLKPRGLLVIIQRADRLGDVLSAFDNRVGDVGIRPLAARDRRPATLVIISARKDAKGPLTLHEATPLHYGDRHTKDGDSYRDDVSAVLRDGASWPWVRG